MEKFYFEYYKAQENLGANKKFNLQRFQKVSIRTVYDSLHGISKKVIPLSNAVEIMAYCLVDGKVEQESEFEMNLYNELLEQLREMKAGFPKGLIQTALFDKIRRYHNNLPLKPNQESSQTNICINLALPTDHWSTN